MPVKPGDRFFDYKLSQLAPEDIKYIMSGQVAEKTPTVLKGTIGTNVFLFWGSQNLEEREFVRIFDWAEGHFRKMLLEANTQVRLLHAQHQGRGNAQGCTEKARHLEGRFRLASDIIVDTGRAYAYLFRKFFLR